MVVACLDLQDTIAVSVGVLMTKMPGPPAKRPPTLSPSRIVQRAAALLRPAVTNLGRFNSLRLDNSFATLLGH